jgi:hypothetical protein
MTSFRKNLLCVILAITAGFGTVVKATPSPGEDFLAEEECVPEFSVSFQLPERVIAVNQQNSCPVASQVYVHLANEVRRLPPIVATQSLEYHQKWVSQQDPVAELGSYGVLHVEYFPSQFVSRLSQRDQRIVIVGIHQNASAPALPQVTLPLAPRQEVAPEPAKAQGSTLAIGDIIRCLLNTPIRFVGWSIDFSHWKACLPS